MLRPLALLSRSGRAAAECMVEATKASWLLPSVAAPEHHQVYSLQARRAYATPHTQKAEDEPSSSSQEQQGQGAQAEPLSTPSSSSAPVQPRTFSVAPHITDANSTAPLMSAQYASSGDDKLGVQKNWFTALYKQINYMAKTGTVPALKGRQREVFEKVEADFEVLYERHIKDKSMDESSHRSLLMCCLAIATYRTLNEEIEDTRLVREVIRTNLGSAMVAILKPIHKFRLWLFRHLLMDDMYEEAVKFLPALQKDMGGLCSSEITTSDQEAVLKVKQCTYHDILTQEDAPFLLTEFCCHHALMWMHDFRKHGVVVSMDECKAWDDSCCALRVARPGQPKAAEQQPGEPPEKSA